MEKKTCFILMPISDCLDYPAGHFSRVFEHIIKPACDLADFNPIRADDIMTTNYIALDVIKKIIESEMALCDLSSRNPNVLYELGIRQAFNLPVTLIKDIKTKRIFDIQGLRDIEYDESLRIDNVESIVIDLSEVIKNTYDNRSKEINSLVSLLGIEPAKLSEKKKISGETELILNSLSSIDKRMTLLEERSNPALKTSSMIRTIPPIRSLPENVGELLKNKDIQNLKVGDKLFHIRFGAGEIESLDGNLNQKTATIRFEGDITRKFAINLAKYQIYKFTSQSGNS